MEQYPNTWRWSDDGTTVEGAFVRLSEGPTSYGPKPIVELDLGDEHRCIWLLEQTLRSKFAEELRRRRASDFTPGERIRIERGEKVKGASGYWYWKFHVDFPDAQPQSAADILGEPVPEPEAAPLAPAGRSRDPDDDPIPF